MIGNGNTFADQLRLFFFKQRLCLTEFVQRRDHREHDAQLAVNRSPDQSAQLSSENISSVQAQTNGAVAQERVHFFREREVRQFLIAADIQRPDDDLLAAHAFQNCLICFKLFVLAREVQFAVHI